MRASIFTGAVVVGVALVIGACGGDKKKAKDPTDEGPPPSSNDETPKWEGASRVSDTGSSSGGSSGSGATSGSSGAAKSSGGPVQESGPRRTDVYDKEATDIPLKRAARQVKDNCGQAKDDNGKATGPWGKVTIQIMLGHNGHSKEVTIPAPYAEKAVGRCIEKAFTNLTFPPWAGADTQITQDVELVEPGKEKK
jgi:hypothetical protein